MKALEFESFSQKNKFTHLKVYELIWRRRRDSNLQSNPLAVPKIVCSLFTSHNFDRYANSHSLYPPQAAVVFLARAFVARVRVLTASQNKKDTLLGVFFIWRRRRDSNSRAGFPTYALSRGASSPT